MAYTTINKSTDYFNTKLYNGTGSSNAITGVGFQPDFTWIKRRNSATAHHLHNAISGATKVLNSNTSNAESTDAQKLSSFDSDGFTVGTNGDANNSSGTFVSWNWKANGAGSANTDGTINSTVSANTTSGFSIVKWTGTGSAGTIGHGLSAEPQVIIVKKLNSSESWFSYHKPLGNTGRLVLNATDGVATDAGYWNSTTPTNQVFYVTSNGSNNASNDIYIAYCFANITGYSKFGSYTGNGNADGTFVYTGFTPSFFLIKRTDGTNSWRMWDNKRDPFNVRDSSINANESDAEYTDASVYRDFVSNGVKIRSTGDNVSGGNYIYMAFAQAPLVGSNGVTAKAR